MSISAYPLQWPVGWPRTPWLRRQDSKYRFRRNGSFWTFAAARDALGTELDRIGARNVVLSTNYELRLDGLPRGNGPTPVDTGVAVYFVLKEKQMAMACDMRIRAEENMRSIALALEAMRQLERHGGGVMMERAFEGFTALPSPETATKRPWREVFGFQSTATTAGISPSLIETRYRELAKQRHPDAPGGSHELMAELNAAKEEALKEIGAK